jgi:hypothetical protein
VRRCSAEAKKQNQRGDSFAVMIHGVVFVLKTINYLLTSRDITL